jgi:hypothetical protein
MLLWYFIDRSFNEDFLTDFYYFYNSGMWTQIGKKYPFKIRRKRNHLKPKINAIQHRIFLIYFKRSLRNSIFFGVF